MRLHVEIVHAIKYLLYEIYYDDLKSHVTTPKINVLFPFVNRMLLTGKQRTWLDGCLQGLLKIGRFITLLIFEKIKGAKSNCEDKGV